MKEVKLRLDTASWEGLQLDYGAVANIYDVTSDAQGRRRRTSDSQRLRNLAIPMGPSSAEDPAFLSIPLEPGRYIVEATPPNGEVISDEIVVDEAAEPLLVRLSGEASPHELLSWQYYAGNVESAMSYSTHSVSKDLRVLNVDLVSVWARPPAGRDAATLAAPDGLVSRGLFFDLPEAKSFGPSSLAGDLIPFDETGKRVQAAAPQAAFSDAASQVYALDSGLVVSLHGESSAATNWRWGDSPGRHYLLVRGENTPPQYSVLPLPWMQVDGAGEAIVEALVQTRPADPAASGGTDQGHRIAITVRDRLVGSVLGYLGAGQLSAAATILGQAEEAIERQARSLLFSKGVNQPAAAAGAYALLAAQGSGKRESWYQWVANLNNWFPWLPDGAIQYAWVLLRQDRSEEGLKQARASLLEGYRRGLPYFSKGVSLLLDGLTLFADDAREAGTRDLEVEAARKVVWRLALRTNPRQLFTSVLLH